MKLIHILTETNNIPPDLEQLFPDFMELRELVQEFGKGYDAANDYYKTLIKRFSFPLPIWRTVDLSTNKLDLNNVGVHWTWDKSKAKAYSTTAGKRIDDPKHITLHTSVNSSQINWKSTIAYNLVNPDEREITMIKNQKIKIGDQLAVV